MSNCFPRTSDIRVPVYPHITHYFTTEDFFFSGALLEATRRKKKRDPFKLAIGKTGTDRCRPIITTSIACFRCLPIITDKNIPRQNIFGIWKYRKPRINFFF